MQLISATKMQAGYTMGLQPDGCELLVVVVKGTFSIPKNGEAVQLVDEQISLVEADQFSGEPGFSAPIYETDYAPKKARCDVLLNGSAYAMHGRPALKVPVSVQVGSMVKSFNVLGNRIWKRGLVTVSAGQAEPFITMPISYDNAFGGVDETHQNPDKISAFLMNPVGKGYFTNPNIESLVNKPLPNTEELNNPVTRTDGKYQPMSFGPIGRSWQPRIPFAGIYDENWLDNVFPFLPADFKEDYYQSAPPEQQIEYPKGGEKVILTNLTPQGRTTFSLPRLDIPILFFSNKGDETETRANMDTIVIEPDLERFTLTWRSWIQLKKNMFEIVQVVAGKMPAGWYRARKSGKTYYRSLNELIESKNED